MPSHGDLALDNFKLASNAPTAAWKITFYFYAAVHAIDHHVFRGVPADEDHNHDLRFKYVREDDKLCGFKEDYRDLFNLSIMSRYEPDTHPPPDSEIAKAERIARRILTTVGLLARTKGPVGIPKPPPGSSGPPSNGRPPGKPSK
jgi:hypothetical protein